MTRLLSLWASSIGLLITGILLCFLLILWRQVRESRGQRLLRDLIVRQLAPPDIADDAARRAAARNQLQIILPCVAHFGQQLATGVLCWTRDSILFVSPQNDARKYRFEQVGELLLSDGDNAGTYTLAFAGTPDSRFQLSGVAPLVQLINLATSCSIPVGYRSGNP